MSRAATQGTPVDSGKSAATFNSPDSYLHLSARPLISLVFLLPFVVIYELGTRYLLTDPVQGTQHIVAFSLLQKVFGLIGLHARHLPAMCLAAILLAWHLARKDSWTINLATLAGMLFECVALSVPVIVLGMVLARLLPMAATAAPAEGLQTTLVLAFGAGVYEELVFRLMLCTALAILLKNVLKLHPKTATLLLVVLSATLFSAYHYLGNESFHWRIFVFRMVAGVYFAGLFMGRGFGITAGTHIAYDIIVGFF